MDIVKDGKTNRMKEPDFTMFRCTEVGNDQHNGNDDHYHQRNKSWRGC